jgi:carbamoyltransferase
MNVLGLHFGHDAAACVLRDGRIASYVLRERHARIKHAISLDLATITKALAAAGITPEEVDL